METLASPTTSSNTSASAQSEYTRFRACDECRRRKIKCDGRVSGCKHCLNSAVQCVYNINPTRASRKRAASSQKNASDPETAVNLEERLARIERAVKEHLTSRLSAAPHGAKDLGARKRAETSPLGEEGGARQTNPNPPKLKERALYLWKVANEGSIQNDGGLLQDFQGKLKFIGESSVFSLFLPRGMQWVCEKIGEPHYSDPLSRAAVMEWNQNPPEDIMIDVSSGYKTCTAFFEGADAPLPARHVVRKYVNDYFDRVNLALPIFNRERFDVELGMFYQNGSRASPSWLLSFYVIMALGCVSNPAEESVTVRGANEAQSLELFRTGCRNIPTVLFCNRDLGGVQALLVTVLFLWESQSPEGCFTLLGVVASIGSEIGLHRCGTQLGLDPHEVELRRNVFWVAYILDKDIALRIGRPSSIVDGDVTVKLPPRGANSCDPRLFYHRARLARILSKVSRLLCSQVSTTLPDTALLETIKMLDAELEEWKSGCEMMHDDEETLGSGEQVSALHNARLRLVYFSCLGAIKRPLSPAFDLQEGDDPESGRLSEGFETCLFAARSSIRLIDFLQRRNLKLLRSTAIHLVAATVTLFTNILHNPLAESTAGDMRHIKRVSEYLRSAVENGCPKVSEMFFLTYTLYSMASQTIARFQSGIGTGGGRGGTSVDSDSTGAWGDGPRGFCLGNRR